MGNKLLSPKDWLLDMEYGDYLLIASEEIRNLMLEYANYVLNNYIISQIQTKDVRINTNETDMDI